MAGKGLTLPKARATRLSQGDFPHRGTGRLSWSDPSEKHGASRGSQMPHRQAAKERQVAIRTKKGQQQQLSKPPPTSQDSAFGPVPRGRVPHLRQVPHAGRQRLRLVAFFLPVLCKVMPAAPIRSSPRHRDHLPLEEREAIAENRIGTKVFLREHSELQLLGKQGPSEPFPPRTLCIAVASPPGANPPSPLKWFRVGRPFGPAEHSPGAGMETAPTPLPPHDQDQTPLAPALPLLATLTKPPPCCY